MTLIKGSTLAHEKTKIDLRGPQGNVFFLIGSARRYAGQLGLDVEAITADMTSSDYDHAVEVFDKHFGSVIDLITTD